MRSAWLTLFGLLALATPGIVARLETRDDRELAAWMARQPMARIVVLEGIAISGMLFLAAAVAV